MINQRKDVDPYGWHGPDLKAERITIDQHAAVIEAMADMEARAKHAEGEVESLRRALGHRTQTMLAAADKLESGHPEHLAVARVLRREAHEVGGRSIR